ncbi:hypothetical protein Tco_1338016 [Tanacetum coccineum]
MQPQASSVLHNDTVSSCSNSKVQEKTQLSRSQCNEHLRAINQMTNKYFAEYIGIEVKQFKDTLLQHMENKIDTGKALDADLVVTKSSGTDSKMQDESSWSENDTDADDADIRPIYDEEPMAEIFIGYRFSPNKTFVVYEKTSPRSDLRWKPTGRIFKTVGLSGVLWERYSLLVQARMTVNPHMVQK